MCEVRNFTGRDSTKTMLRAISKPRRGSFFASVVNLRICSKVTVTCSTSSPQFFLHAIERWRKIISYNFTIGENILLLLGNKFLPQKNIKLAD